MKNKLLLFLSFGLMLLGFYSRSYSQLQITNPNTSFAACPGQWIQYQLNNSSPATTCFYTWTVTNGEIQGGFQNGNVSTISGYNVLLVSIRWFDITTQSGTINIKSESCDNATGQGVLNVSVPIKSVNGVTPSVISGNPTITVNSVSTYDYEIPAIAFPNLGASDPNPTYVASYEWEIPAGWTATSGATTKKITVTPNNCSGGNLRVRGKHTSCSGNTYYTNWSPSKVVTRVISNPSAITMTPSTVLLCSDVSVRTFSIPSVNGATSYVWTKPAGWSGSSTSTSINLTPDGVSGADITVKAEGCGLQSGTPSTLSVPINLYNPANPPVISGDNPVCTSSTLFVTNQPPNTTVSWSASGTLINSSTGVITRNNYLNATANITANISGACGNLPPITRFQIIGTPYFQDGSSNLCSNDRLSSAYYYSNSPLAYTWETYLGTELVDGGAGGSYSAYGSQLGNGTFKLKAGNLSCTPANKWRQTTIWVTTCSLFAGLSLEAYPNPATSTLTVELTDSLSAQAKSDKGLDEPDQVNILDEPYQITILDKFSKKVFSKQTQDMKNQIPIDGLLPDTYYLVVQHNDVVLRRQILIKK